MPVSKNPDMTVRLDDDTNEMLQAYAERLYPDQSGKGNRSEAVRQILRNVLIIEEHPEVQKILKQNFILGNDVLVFLRAVVENFFSAKHNLDVEFRVDPEDTNA